MLANLFVIIAAILLVFYSRDAITWFDDDCKYKYHVSITTEVMTRDCSDNDKSKGKQMYLAIFVMTLLLIPLTIGMLGMITYVNRVLFEDGLFGGICFRRLIYKAKGNGNTTVSNFR